jgi:hypothetical protein
MRYCGSTTSGCCRKTPPSRRSSCRCPKGAVAIKFGSAGEKLPGFRTVAPSASSEGKKEGFDSAKGLSHGGLGWPDALTGTFVIAEPERAFTFRTHVPKGEYRALLFAGPGLHPKPSNRTFLLRLNDRTVIDTTPSVDEYYSEKFLYRFLKTTFSARPDALWEDYVAKMYPAHDLKINAADGVVTLEAQNHFISALVLVPAALPQKEWGAFVAETRALRVKAFNDVTRPEKHVAPAKTKDDGDFVLFVPEFGRRLTPSSGPSAAERKRTSLSAAGVPGQLVTLRVAVTPFADLGTCKFEAADLKGPATIPAKAIASYLLIWRFDGENLSEMALLPTGSAALEKGITREWYFTLTIPADAKAGLYKSTWSFKPAEGKAVSVPVQIEVYPFTLEEILPLSLGMYYGPRHEPLRDDATNRRLLKEQVLFMRRLGMTAVAIGTPTVTGLRGGNKVAMRFDSAMIEIAKDVGMGRHPAQYQMGGTLGVGRGIGRRLPGSLGAKVDQNPGIELRQPGFSDYFLDALKQQRAFYEKSKLPIAVEVVDEPREVPNPWNRNLADTISYAKMVKEAGLVGFVTPMSDSNGGKDYTALVDHVDVVSIHAWKASEKLLKKTHEKKKTLWLYNTGMDRYSWGFYAWRVGAAGRWEWHFCFAEDQAKNGYPGREWFNPFTSSHGLAPYAPAEYPGGMLFASAFLDAAEGITDYAYLYTLERLIEKRAKSERHAKAVKEARDYLRALKGAMPELPGVKGLANADDGALVGLGVEDEARLHAQKWRAKIAALIQALN